MAMEQTVQAKFIANADGFLSKFKAIENQLENLPRVTEKATDRMNNDFDSVGGNLKKLDDVMKKSGKSFDSKTLTAELNKAQAEFKETGNVSKATMESLNKEIKAVDFKALPAEAKKQFNEVKKDITSVERQFNKLNDVKFLENLPEDSRKAGIELLNMEKNITKIDKAMEKTGDGFDTTRMTRQLDNMKNELQKTGAVSEKTFNELQAEINETDFNKLSFKAQTAFRSMDDNVDKMKQSLSTVDGAAAKAGKGLTNNIGGASKAVGGLKGALGTLGPAIGAAFAGGAVVGFAKQMVDATAEINALDSQYEQVMGKMKGTTDKYLGEMAQRYNVHPNELKKSMLQFQAILKSKGLSEKEAYETSQKWLERTVDGSAFANESLEESTSRAMAVIKGEYDSADTIMINLSQTMLNDKAQEVYKKKWEELTVAEQQTLKVQEAMRQHTSAGVLGQGVKEADSYERNVARLKATWQDFLAEYGGPALNIANNALKGGITIIDNLGGALKKISDTFKGLTGGNSVNIMQKLGFSNAEANNIINWFNILKQQLSIAGGAVKDFVVNGFGSIKAFFTGPDGQQLLQAVKNIFMGIMAVVKFVFPLVKFIIQDVWNNIVNVIKGGMQVIQGVIQVFSGLFTGDFKKMWEGIKNIFAGAIRLIWNGVQLLFYGKLLKGVLGFAKLFAGGLKSMWGSIVGFFKTYGSAIYKSINGVFTNMLKGVMNIFGRLVKWLLSSIKGMATNSINLFKNLGKGVANVFTAMRNAISKVWGAIKTLTSAAVKFVYNTSTKTFSSMWKFVTGRMAAMRDGIGKAWSAIKTAAKSAGSYVYNTVTGAFKSMHSGVKGWIDKVKGLMTGMKDSVVKSAVALKNGIRDHAIGGLNKMIDGINWVSEKIGMGKPLSKINTKYSTGTGGHPEDGWATVGDKGPGNGKGTRELVQFPNGKTALFEKETTFYMPKGTQVLNNQQTEPILESVGYSRGTTGQGASLKEMVAKKTAQVAAGTIGAVTKVTKKGQQVAANVASGVQDGVKTVSKIAGDIWDYATNPSKLVSLAMDKFGVGFGSLKGFTGDLMSAMYGKLKSGMAKKFKEWFDEAGGDADGSSFMGYPKTTPYHPNGPTPGYPTAFNGGRHFGIDYGTPVGVTLKAPTAGTVTRQNDFGGGLVAILRSGKYNQYFMHLSSLFKTGSVKKGEAFAKTGNSGNWTTGPHLHYQVNTGNGAWNSNTINPETFLKSHNPGLISGGGNSGGGNVNSWIRQAIARTGVPSSWAGYLNTIAKYESGYNPNAVQHGYVDVNTGGNEARGLMQVTPKTYQGVMGTSAGIMNPVNNVIASIKWIKARYGSVTNIPGMASGTWHGGYANGGIVSKDGIYRAGEEGKELVIPLAPKRRSRANELLALGDSLVNKGNARTDLKTSKEDIAVGKLIKDKMKTIKTDSLTTLYKNVQDITKKIDSVIKANASKVATAKTKIASYADKNIDEQYKIEALEQEKRLNGKTGKITVKTRLPKGDTTKVDASIKSAKTKIAAAQKKLKELGTQKTRIESSLKRAKTSADKKKWQKELNDTIKKINAEKKVQTTQNKNLKAYEKQRNALLNRYKVETKTVKGRTAAQINKAIESSKKKIADNKKQMSLVKAETNTFNAQTKNLQAIKKNELLKAGFLKQLVDRRAELVKALTALEEKQQALQEERESFKSSVAENLMGYAGFEGAKGNTARDFVEFMKYRLNRMKKFANNVTKLKNMGLDPEILKNIIAGGIDSAIPKVEMLIAGGKGYITQINDLQKQVKAEVDKISGQAAYYSYNAEQGAVAREIKENKAEQARIETAKNTYVTKVAPATPAKKTTTTTAKKTTTTTKKTTATKAVPKMVNHVIKWGDTLWDLANKYATSIAAIKKANNLKSDLIIAGKTLKIPKGVKAYADGGIAVGAQLAYIAEGGFAESIISHDPSKRKQQRDIWKKTGDKLGFTGTDEQVQRQILAVLQDIREINGDYASKPVVASIDARKASEALSPYMSQSLAKRQKFTNRGLADNGR